MTTVHKYSQNLGEDFAKFCGFLRIYELYRGYVSVGAVDACDPRILRTRHLAPMNKIFRFIGTPGFKFLTQALIITKLFFTLTKLLLSFFSILPRK